MARAQEKPEVPPVPPRVILVDLEEHIKTRARLEYLEAELLRCQPAQQKTKRPWHDHPALIVALLGVPLIVAIAKKP